MFSPVLSCGVKHWLLLLLLLLLLGVWVWGQLLRLTQCMEMNGIHLLCCKGSHIQSVCAGVCVCAFITSLCWLKQEGHPWGHFFLSFCGAIPWIRGSFCIQPRLQEGRRASCWNIRVTYLLWHIYVSALHNRQFGTVSQVPSLVGPAQLEFFACLKW